MDKERKVNKLIIHQILLIGALLILGGSRLLFGVWNLNTDVIFWLIGGIVGFLFVFADRLVYIFWQQPNETLSIKMKDLWARGRIFQGVAMVLRERDEQKSQLMMRSVLFLAAWLALAVFAMSSGNPFGRGFMLGLGLHLGFDLAWDYFDKSTDVRLWFWQIKREMTDNEIKAVVWGFLILATLLGIGL